jgi:hypothetical protein
MDHRIGCYLVHAHAPPFFLNPPLPDKALLLVETRPSFFLPHVVASAVRTHPGWRLYVFGTPDVHALLRDSCPNFELATCVTLPSGRLTPQGFSELMMSSEVWGRIAEEHVLVFQTDCVLVRPTPSRFLAFDYVGAVCGLLHPERFVMNGGLSLRRRSAMLRAVRQLRDRHPDLLGEPEDVALCRCMRMAGDFTLPTMKDCNQFAIESLGDPSRAIGMHGTDKYYAAPELVRAMLESA